MGAGGGFGMVLEGEGAEGGGGEAFDAVVVEAAVGDLRDGGVEGVFHHDEVVVLGGDFDGAVGEVFDGMVAAVVAEGEARGLGPQGDGQELVPQADAHDGEFAEKGADGLDGVREGGGVGGAVGEEDAVWVGGEEVGGAWDAGKALM